ncbi:FAD-dependent oxidoreductase [Paenibacillus sp. N1-5-1-14]|uniref:FAD-dependent oxidoreductase n=1 Tax=Paenibacillus radicibacter TaxID=2972488 RepID=UPI002158A275|nr:FAD-dependent oxidoreductase [Paenibacillus radicibacter]MCR8643211.1 FAD-dependent oxidoreductase [Paenibacillus radicibacter]
MYDIIIVGAGPAGASAAIFSAKAGLKTLVLDNDKGMTKRAWIENHYGVMEIDGPSMVELGKKQALKFGAEIVETKVTFVGEAEAGEGLVVETEGGNYEAKHVILATGAIPELAENSGLTIVDGTEPRIKFVAEVDEFGRTSTPGIWAAGVAAGVSVHSIITAGDGARVAINVISEIKGQRYVDHDVLKA